MLGFKVKFVVGVIITVLVAASFGYIIFDYLPGRPQSANPVVVSSNTISLFKVPAPIFGTGPAGSRSILGTENVYLGVWGMNLRNDLNTPLHLVASLYVNEVPQGSFESATLGPHESLSFSSCVGFQTNNGPNVVVKIVGFSGSTEFTPAYPVSFVNATQVPYSRQFSVSNNLTVVANSPFGGRGYQWSTVIENSGAKSIDWFLFRELRNSTFQYSVEGNFRCSTLANSASGGLAYLDFVPIGSGQMLTMTESMPQSWLTAGSTYVASVVAGYSDGTEVTYSAQVRIPN